MCVCVCLFVCLFVPLQITLHLILWSLVQLRPMMEAESKVIVYWSYDYQIMKGSSDKYNLNKDCMKVLHKRLGKSVR